MKKLILGLLVLSFTTSGFADCRNAYTIKEKKRAHTNMVVKKAAIITTGVVVGTGLAVAVVASGASAAVIVAPLFLGAHTVAGVNFAMDVEVKYNNTFTKAKSVILGANAGVIPGILLEELDKEISYYSLSNQEQKEMRQKIANIVVNANMSKEFCPVDNGKIKPLTFKKMTKLIVEKLHM